MTRTTIRRLLAAAALIATLAFIDTSAGATGQECTDGVSSPYTVNTGSVWPSVWKVYNTANQHDIPTSSKVTVAESGYGWLIQYTWACPE